MATSRPWRTPRLPDLVGAREAAKILGISRMGLYRWMEPGSGTLGPDRTYMVPPKQISSGPVWVRSDIERFRVEVGRKNAGYGDLVDQTEQDAKPVEPGPPVDAMLPIGPFQKWLKRFVNGRPVPEVARQLGMTDPAVRAVIAGRRRRMQLSAIARVLQLADDGTTVEQLYPKL